MSWPLLEIIEVKIVGKQMIIESLKLLMNDVYFYLCDLPCGIIRDLFLPARLEYNKIVGN